jgi:conjugal transfer pilus assembly protein TraK
LINKILLAAAASVMIWATSVYADNVITPEIPVSVQLSNRDVNRIVCPGQMNDLIFSQEKGLTGHFSGTNAFIKFKIKEQGEEYVYADTPSELFVVCSGAVYTLLVTPRDIPSVTLRLASPQGDTFKENIAHYRNLPLEKQALQIIREAYNGTYPSSYRVSAQNKQLTLSPDLAIQLLQNVEVDGVGLRLKKYQAKSQKQEAVTVDESLFLSPLVSSSILAVAVEDHILPAGTATLVYVVEKKESEQ